MDYGRKLIEGDPHEVMASDEVRDVYLGADPRRSMALLEVTALDAGYGISRRCSGSTSRSTRARPSPSSAPTAPASRRC